MQSPNLTSAIPLGLLKKLIILKWLMIPGCCCQKNDVGDYHKKTYRFHVLYSKGSIFILFTACSMSIEENHSGYSDCIHILTSVDARRQSSTALILYVHNGIKLLSSVQV